MFSTRYRFPLALLFLEQKQSEGIGAILETRKIRTCGTLKRYLQPLSSSKQDNSGKRERSDKAIQV